MASKKSADIARRVLGAALVIGLLVAATVFYTVAPTPTPPVASPEAGSTDSETENDQAQTGGPDQAESTATVTVEAPGSNVAPAEAIPADGPGVDEPGILMLVQPTAAGPLLVTEQVRLPAATTSITLAPPDLSRAGAAFAEAETQAINVQVSAGNQPVRVPDGVVSESTTLDVPRGNGFEVSYELTGAMVRSVPSTARRALTGASPLFAEAPPYLPVVVVAAGPSVLGLNCPLLSLSERACGQGTLLARQTNSPLKFKNALVTVQFDLPKL